MHLHLTNCHGEWLAVAMIAAQAPFLGMWLRNVFSPNRDEDAD